MAGNLKFIGKPKFKNKRTYYAFLVCLWLATGAVIIIAYFCYYRWDSPTYLNIILWVILALLAGGGGEIYFESYEKYKASFEDPVDGTNNQKGSG